MLSIAVNALGSLLSWLNKIEISDTKSMNDLPCKVTEINEMQEFQLPNSAVESNEQRGDTIYRMPKQITARLFVEASDYLDFENQLQDIQFDENYVKITSLSNKTYTNLKIKSWSVDTTSDMVGASYYIVNFQEFILVEALANLKAMPAGAGDSQKLGTKVPQEQKKTKALKLSQEVGLFK